MANCTICNNKIIDKSPISELCASCFRKYKNATDKYLGNLTNAGDFGEMYIEIETAIEKSQESHQNKENLKMLFGNWIFKEANTKLGVTPNECLQDESRMQEARHSNERREQDIKIMKQKQLEKKKALASMLITSGFSFDGYTIKKYSGYISGDDVIQVSRGLSIFGVGTTDAGEELSNSLVKIRRNALAELKEAAYNLGCNAVIGVDFDYITLDPETANITGGTTYLPYVFCVTANGNAVVIEKDTPSISVSSVLKEYKELLDCGIITLDEFESKKRELLN